METILEMNDVIISTNVLTNVPATLVTPGYVAHIWKGDASMDILTHKKCSKCGETKPLSDFPLRKDSKDGYRGYCKACDNLRYAQWRANNRERSREGFKRHYYKNIEKERESGREKHRQLRLEVITAYGGKCVCCGESINEFLSIDHINGDGHLERVENPNTYRLLKKNGFPKESYRLLCHNCNQALGHYGYCPHNKEMKQPLWWEKKTHD